jgi:hypothetical protein
MFKKLNIKLRILASVIMGAASITALAYLPEGIGTAMGGH